MKIFKRIFIVMLVAVLLFSVTACNDGNIKDVDILDRLLKDSSKYISFDITVEFDYGETIGIETYNTVFVKDKGVFISIPDGNNVYYDKREDGYFYTYTFTEEGYKEEEIDEEEIERVEKGVFGTLSEQLRLIKGVNYEYSSIRHGFVIKSVKDKSLKDEDLDILIVMKEKNSADISAIRRREYVEERIALKINTAELNFPDNIIDEE